MILLGIGDGFRGDAHIASFHFDEHDKASAGGFHDKIDLTAVVGTVVSEKEAVALFSEVAFGELFAEASGCGGGFLGIGCGWLIPSEELVDEPAQTRGGGWGRGRGGGVVRGGVRCRTLCGLRMRIGGIFHRAPSSAYRARLLRGCWRLRC